MSGRSYLLYQRRDSLLEQGDPRAKIVTSLLLAAGLLIGQDWLWKSALVALLIVLWGLAQLPWRMLGWTVLSLALYFLSTMIYHTFLLPAPDAAFVTVGSLRISPEGVVSGVAMCEQILGVVMLLSLLVRTTSPIILAEGMELLLAPLKRWKFPVHEAVMMFSIALRFIPMLFEEFDKISKAQIARGAGFQRGGVRSRFRGVLPMLIPMFVFSIMRAKELAVAMESRCYHSGQAKTPIRNYAFTAGDYAASIAAVALFGASFFFR